jgi:hypothetical protein
MSQPPAEATAGPDFLYITRSALTTIEQQARRASGAEAAAAPGGGMLFGGRINQNNQQYDVLLVAAPAAGAYPLPSLAAFSPDDPDVVQNVQAQQAGFPRMDALGTWHMRPATVPAVTQEDIDGAYALLQRTTQPRDEVLLAVASVQPNADVTLRYFLLRRAAAERGESFTEVASNRVYVVEDNDPLVERERATPGTVAETAPGTNRMDEEFRTLAARGYRVSLREQPQGNQFAVRDNRLPDLTVYFITPPGYPTTAPQVVGVRDGERVSLPDTNLQRTWNLRQGQVYLADLMDELVSALLYGAPQPTPGVVLPGGGGQPPSGAVPGYEAYDEYGDEDEPDRGDEVRIPRSYLIGGGVFVALVALLALVFLVFLPGTRDASAYEDIWQQVDQVAQQPDPSEEQLRTAIERLEQVRDEDPQGEVYPRNAEVVPTLTRLYVLLGNQYMQQEPPNLAAAEESYRSALALSPEDPAAQAGLQSVTDARTEQAVNEALNQSAAETWQQIEASSDPAERVRLIEALQLIGIEADPQGTPTAVRLHQARMTLANSQLEAENYSAARATAERAVTEAPDDVARQEAINMLARIYLAEGQTELEADRLSSARTAFESVLNLQPPPANDLLAQAQQGLEQVENAEGQLSTQELVQQSWQSYDAAMAQQDWNAAISALDAIIGMTGPAPTREEYPSPPYDPRTYDVAEVQAQVRLIEAERLQREGNIAAAQAQYDAVLTGAGPITQATRQAAANAVERLNTARGLWNQVNSAQAAEDWATMRDALQALSNLEGFGPQARNPQGGQTVESLLALANDRLEQAAQTPTATTIPPSPTAEPPTATPTAIPQPPTTAPLPTATAAPPTATAAPPSPTSEPATPTEELPAATATSEPVTYETYDYPSGLFSIEVPQDWSSTDESETGLARVDFAAPREENYGISVRVSAAPEGATASDLEQLIRDFIQEEFGGEDELTVDDQVETRSDGQVALGFRYSNTPFLGATITVPGRVVGQLDGDKLSLMVSLFEGGEDTRTPARIDVINTILDSYTVDPTIALP